jgi:hypothetical protein
MEWWSGQPPPERSHSGGGRVEEAAPQEAIEGWAEPADQLGTFFRSGS